MKSTGNRADECSALPCELVVRHQGMRPVLKVPPFKRAVRHVLQSELGLEAYCLGILLVPDSLMTRVNESFLGHEGSTDVITFDHTEPGPMPSLHGELYICPDEAERQARKFRVHWTEEILRYAIHGILHLRGFDDHAPEDQVIMKREEDRLFQSALTRCRPRDWEH